MGGGKGKKVGEGWIGGGGGGDGDGDGKGYWGGGEGIGISGPRGRDNKGVGISYDGGLWREEVLGWGWGEKGSCCPLGWGGKGEKGRKTGCA